MSYDVTNRFEQLTKRKKAGPISLLACSYSDLLHLKVDQFEMPIELVSV